MTDEPPWWDTRVGKRLLKTGATYESDNAGNLPPFHRFVFLVLAAWKDRDGDLGARILILQSDDNRLYPPGSVNEINPAFWLYTGARRLT